MNDSLIIPVNIINGNADHNNHNNTSKKANTYLCSRMSIKTLLDIS